MREPSSHPLRRRCRFRITWSSHRWPSSIVGGYLSGIGSCGVRLLGDGLIGDRQFVARELWWGGYQTPPSSLIHVEAC